MEPADRPTDRSIAARIELAHLRLLAGDKDGALAECKAVLASRPTSAEAYREKAEILLALDKQPEAEESLKRYLAVGGKPSPEVFRALGLLAAQRRDYATAVDAYSEALHSHRKAGFFLRFFQQWREAEILSSRGWAFVMQDAAKPALADFDAALKCAPTHADALCGRGTALTLRGQPSDMTEAMALAEKALDSAPRSVPRLFACAKIYARAAEVLEKDLRRLRNDPETIHCQQRALDLLAEAVEAVPANEPPSARRAMLNDPVFVRLQTTTRWRELVAKYRQ